MGVLWLPLLFAQFSLSGSADSAKAGNVNAVLSMEQSKDDAVLFKVKVDFPEGFHQVLDRDNFFLELVSPEGLVSGSTLYPPAQKDSRGIDSYAESCVLALEIPSQGFAGLSDLSDFAEKAEDSKGIVRLHYQLCNEEGQCFFPETLDMDFDIGALEGMVSRELASQKLSSKNMA